ncbi:MAG: tripartite tricarboxylate transporter permease [Alphaproteobacteria bacterium]
MTLVFNAFIAGLWQLFALKAFLLQLFGIAIGFLVGILPGIGGPVTLALMLPFIYKMDSIEAFSFLLGMAAVTATTGDITSILFGIPGEAITASVIVDGHPMAKKGEAGRALGAALMSSFIGAVFGAFCLAIAVPLVRPLVLSVQSPQYFMFSILGIAFLASLTTGAVVKGLAAAALGLLFATVGLDPISGIERYTFDTLYLWDGIRLVPATLGLFAIPEVIDMAVQGTSIAQAEVGRLGGVLQGVKDTFIHWSLVLRCSAIGAYIGVLPGMGASVSQWVSYAHAVQSSKNQERFGKGAVEGVLGPSAANHSTLGGALVPTVAFGVPGSVVMAILLGAFIIQGLVPGPSMLTPESRGGHLSLTFSFVWLIVVSNIITVSVCFLFLDKIAKITQIRGSLVIPFVLLLIYIGAFAENSEFGDVIVTLVFGILGWVMVELDWSRPPLLLGLVLGKLAERSLFLAVDNYGTRWLYFPSILVLFAIILAGTFYPVLKRLWRKRHARTEQLKISEPEQALESKTAQVSLWAPVFSFLAAALFAWALWQGSDWGLRARLFPWVIGFIGLPLTVVQFALDLRGIIKRKPPQKGAVPSAEEGAGSMARRTAQITGWIVGYFAALLLFGFSVAIPLMTLLYLKVARERWLIALLLTLSAWGLYYGLFEYALHVPFPTGLLLNWLPL